jgi:hypothetical protein
MADLSQLHRDLDALIEAGGSADYIRSRIARLIEQFERRELPPRAICRLCGGRTVDLDPASPANQRV